MEQGKRRLKRAYKSPEVQSTDAEIVSFNATPVILNNSDLENELENVDPLIIDPDNRFERSIANVDEIASTSRTEKTHGEFSDFPYFIVFSAQFLVSTTILTHIFSSKLDTAQYGHVYEPLLTDLYGNRLYRSQSDSIRERKIQRTCFYFTRTCHKLPITNNVTKYRESW